MNQLKTIGFRITFIFVIGFIIALPFPFYILPDIGKFLSPFFESINEFWVTVINVDEGSFLRIISDSTGLYLHLITLFIVSVFGSLVWTLIQRNKSNAKLKKWFHTGVAHYLALILFKYGFDKVFKHQFYLPEPNTLYTPLGELSPDILFWSSMGSSYHYSVFSGLIELLPAILLLFKKTRLLGGLIAMAVLVNVVMINFGFNISVKVYSLFLLFLSLIVIAPNFKQLYSFFLTNKQVNQQLEEVKFKSNKQLLIYSITKSVVIGLILFESLGGYFEIGNFNDDTYPRPYLHGAYTNIDSKSDIKRVFFHRKQYFIIQYENDKFKSYELEFSRDMQSLVLTDENNTQFSINFLYNETNEELTLKGSLVNRAINIRTQKENLEALSFFDNKFSWTFD